MSADLSKIRSTKRGYKYGLLSWTGATFLFLLLTQVGASSDYPQNNNGNVPPAAPNSQQNSPPSKAEAASPQRFVPLMKPEHVALSLRLTCERNRRLKQGSMLGIRRQPEIVVTRPESHHISLPSSSQQSSEETTTIFHATSRRTGSVLRGAEQWGPNLQTYIEELVSSILQMAHDETSIVLSLSMIYLDRASSVETLRSNGAPPCPFITFRTVHRLFLTSLLTAAQVVGGKPIDEYHEQLEELVGVSSQEIHEMMTWMKYALGDSGHFVGLGEMQKFKHMWERVFSNTGQPGSHPKDNSQKSHPSTSDPAPSGFFTSSATPRQAHTTTPSSSNGNAGGTTATTGVYQQTNQQAESDRFSKPTAFVNSKHSAVSAS